LLLSLKMSTEASLMGADSVDVQGKPVADEVEEVEYSELLKEIPAPVEALANDGKAPTPTPMPAVVEEEDEGVAEEESAAALLRSMEAASPRKMDANYESMSLKELQSLARQRGIAGIPQRKRDLIDALKKQGGAPPAAPTPLEEGEIEADETL
jgi:hypothetical protein